jgi:hypothetical protein
MLSESYLNQSEIEMKAGDHVRQGDVLLMYVDKIPSDAKENSKDTNGLAVLAYGETSGHAHVVEENEACEVVYKRTAEGERFLSLLGQTLISHGNLTNLGVQPNTQDHTALLLHEGKLMQGFQVEDWGDEVRRVAD